MSGMHCIAVKRHWGASQKNFDVACITKTHGLVLIRPICQFADGAVEVALVLDHFAALTATTALIWLSR